MTNSATDAALVDIDVPVSDGPVGRRTSGAGYTVLNAAVAACALIALTPVLVVAAVAVAADGGPVFLRRERAGRDGRAFVLRTFRIPANAAGPVLRRTGADGLPELFSVVTGAMAIVGPRPRPAGGTRRPHGPRAVGPVAKPGLTGLWQVSGRRRLTCEESARLDAAYADAWSPALDLAILRRTAATVLRSSVRN